jgi:SAM-dependent methyltransferase
MATWISTRTGQFAYFDRQLGNPDWAGKRVLDFAGNVGNLLLDPECRIEPENYWSIDVSRDAIPEGRRRHPKGHFIFYDRYNFEYNPTGTVGLPIPDPGVRFDFIVGWSILTHIGKSETLELADQLADLLTDDGRVAFTFLDPWWTPPPGWVRDSESPGMSNLLWRLEARHETKPEMDVAALLTHAESVELTWATLVNDDELIFDPEDDGVSEDKPQRAYITFCTPRYMEQLFPHARILAPVPPERHHCLVTDRSGLRRG